MKISQEYLHTHTSKERIFSTHIHTNLSTGISDSSLTPRYETQGDMGSWKTALGPIKPCFITDDQLWSAKLIMCGKTCRATSETVARTRAHAQQATSSPLILIQIKTTECGKECVPHWQSMNGVCVACKSRGINQSIEINCVSKTGEWTMRENRWWPAWNVRGRNVWPGGGQLSL